MTMSKIETAQQKQNVKFELAKQIRALLDEAKKTYGAQDWDDDELEQCVCELVFEE
jgi:GTPase Era involved in 16S rRNA processing